MAARPKSRWILIFERPLLFEASLPLVLRHEVELVEKDVNLDRCESRMTSQEQYMSTLG